MWGGKSIAAATVSATALAGCALVMAAGAAAAIPSGNIVANRGFEEGPASPLAGVPLGVPGWQTSGNEGAFDYVAADSAVPFIHVSDPGASGCHVLAAGTLGGPAPEAVQTISVADVGEISGGGVTLKGSALLGGYQSDGDYGQVQVQTLNSVGTPESGFYLDGPLVADRSNQTKLTLDTGSIALPATTRQIKIIAKSQRFGVDSNSYDDGYIDNVGLTLDGSDPSVAPPVCQPPAAAPPAIAPGFDLAAAVRKCKKKFPKGPKRKKCIKKARAKAT